MAKSYYTKRRPPLEKRFWNYVNKTGECWTWIGPRTKGGYGKLTVGGHNRMAHRVSYEMEFGSIPAGFYVCHKCDNPPCVRPDHLFAATPKVNTEDSLKKGKPHGCPPRLKPAEVEQIRLVYSHSNFTMLQIGNAWRIHQSLVRRAVVGLRNLSGSNRGRVFPM